MTIDASGTSSGNLHAIVLEMIGRRIVTGEYATNETLNMDAIAKMTGTSRAVLREVFRVLQSIGLVTARPKVGTRVAPPSSWNCLDPQIIRWRLESGDREVQVNELFALRLSVEPVASRLLSRCAPEVALDNLDQQIEAMATAYSARDLHAFAASDVEFHLTIINHCGNAMFRSLGRAIAAAIRTRETLYFPLSAVVLRGLDLHRQLVAEIRSCDPQLEETSRKLIVDAQQETELFLGQWADERRSAPHLPNYAS